MIDVILTSCGRFDLLERTLATFFTFNTAPIGQFLIYEDAGNENLNAPQVELHTRLMCEYGNRINWYVGGKRKGQIHALDTLWRMVKTEYCFQMEDDWEFYQGGFIEKSIAVMEEDAQVSNVWLRERKDVNSHPIVPSGHDRFDYMERNHLGTWHGFSFNPSVKRLSDYEATGGYGKHTEFVPKFPWKSEIAISKVYHDMGRRAAILPTGYIRHIGGHGRGIRS